MNETVFFSKASFASKPFVTSTHMPLDRSILNAKHIVLPAYQQIEFYLVGCGGTGSWLAPSLCRIARTVNYPRFIAGSSLYLFFWLKTLMSREG